MSHPERSEGSRENARFLPQIARSREILRHYVPQNDNLKRLRDGSIVLPHVSNIETKGPSLRLCSACLLINAS